MDRRKRNIVIAVMVAMFLGAIEGTVVTTAIPTIVKHLNSFELISWIFSAYLLTSAITTPIYGKLSDLFGRKITLLIGIIIFLVGSCLCGLSRSMYQLIAFRALQGLGAGAIFTVPFTIVGDVFSLGERARVQGWLGAVWGIASICGPFLGGFLIDTLSWHWIFFINLPFGIISIILLLRNFDENFERKKHQIDYVGSVLLSAAMITLLYGTLSGGMIVISLVLTILLFVAFYYVEKRVEEPIIPFEIFTQSTIIVNVISFLSSAVLMGIDVYMPIYIQNILGFSATISGLALAPMSVSWLIASVILERAIPRYGERVVIGLSTLIMLVSCMLLPTLGVTSRLILVVSYVFIMGLGFGGCLTTLSIMVQESVNYNKRGVATATNTLLRTLGQIVGISIFGTIFDLSIVKYFNNMGMKGIEPNNLYSASGMRNALPPEQIGLSLNSAMHVLFISWIILTLACIVFSFILPSNMKEETVCVSIGDIQRGN